MKTKIVCLFDKSGSMASMEEDVIGSFNQFIKEQQQREDEATLTLVLFNAKTDTVLKDIPIKLVEPLSSATYRVGGSTALLDAIGETLNTIVLEEHKCKCPSCSERVIVCIMTDGLENASTMYSKRDIQRKIKHLVGKHDWAFLFMGADQDAFVEGGNLGIDHDYIREFKKSKKGFESVITCSLSNSVTDYRNGGDGHFVENVSGATE